MQLLSNMQPESDVIQWIICNQVSFEVSSCMYLVNQYATGNIYATRNIYATQNMQPEIFMQPAICNNYATSNMQPVL